MAAHLRQGSTRPSPLCPSINGSSPRRRKPPWKSRAASTAIVSTTPQMPPINLHGTPSARGIWNCPNRCCQATMAQRKRRNPKDIRMGARSNPDPAPSLHALHHRRPLGESHGRPGRASHHDLMADLWRRVSRRRRRGRTRLAANAHHQYSLGPRRYEYPAVEESPAAPLRR